LLAVPLVLNSQVGFAQGTASDQAWTGQTERVGHGGGCRKDSPAGQCCHAGSKPYHCH
jgi:hypothetical protein